MQSIRPLHDNVLVKRVSEESDKIGSIFVPDSAKEKPQQAEVVAVGNGKLLEDGTRATMGVAPGERILFGKYSGSDVKVDGSTYLILREDEILAVLDK
jgi:chaperonin GroES